MKTINRSNLHLEALEARDCPSASPLPVLLVIADQRDFYYSQAPVHSLTTMQQQNSFSGTGILKSQDSGRTWTLNVPSSVGGNETLTVDLNHAFSDYAQWRQRFGTGI